MRHTRWVLGAVLAVSAWATDSRAQNGNGGFDDPFFLYYSYFLPRQAALAAQPHVEDTINQNFANNQATARTNRAGLYDPNGGYGAFDDYDPDNALDNPMKRGGRANSGVRRSARGLPTTNIAGRGPSLYYNRAGQFYPSLRTGVGPNHNLAVTGRGMRRGPGVSSPQPQTGIPGPR
jgi:hypothetical protein